MQFTYEFLLDFYLFWNSGSSMLSSLSSKIAEAKTEVTFDGETGNLQIGDATIGGDLAWNYADGMPEDNGLTYTGTEGKAVMQSDGLLLSDGAEYKPQVLASAKATMECVFSVPSFGTYYGFRMQLTNGTSGIRISCYNDALIYNQNTSNNLRIAELSTNTEYTIRIEWDETDGATVYLNGESVLSEGKTVFELSENLIGKVSGGGTILLKSISYRFDDTEGKIKAINGLEVEQPTTLPNPNALTFTGAVDDSYDGSEAKTIKIPTVDDVLAALPIWEGGSY